MTLEEHSRKQIQMHMAAKAIAESKKLTNFLQKVLGLHKMRPLKSNGEAVTVEPFVDGSLSNT